MRNIDQVAISKTLGSKIKAMGPVRFGEFGARQTTEEIQQAFAKGTSANTEPAFSYSEDALVAQAFEAIRGGAAVDELLWNTSLAASFLDRCKALGLGEASDGCLIRRLLGIRKNAPRYRRHGIVISPTRKKARPPSIGAAHAHVIEFALVKLRYRYGASIDDILIEPALGRKFESLAGESAPSLSSTDLRLGALYIRKKRVLETKKLEAIKSESVKKAWEHSATLAKLDVAAVPESPGLIELSEPKRCLYVSHNENIHAAVADLHSGRPFRLMASQFWQPKLEEITVRYVHGLRIAGFSIETWERWLVFDLHPVFNWPVESKAA